MSAMAPYVSKALLSKRYYCDGDVCYPSNWDNWGRWVSLVLFVLVVVLIAYWFSWCSSRSRNRRGVAPMYGSGWMTPSHKNNPPPHHQSGYYAYQPHGGPAPPYAPPVGAQVTGTTFNGNDGYYGHHRPAEVELMQPESAYQPQRGDPVYDAPPVPPPGKGDGIAK